MVDDSESFNLDALAGGSELKLQPDPVDPSGEADEEQMTGLNTEMAEEQNF